MLLYANATLPIIQNLNGFLGIYEIGYIPGLLFTAFVYLSIMNAINLTDGIETIGKDAFSIGNFNLLIKSGNVVCVTFDTDLAYLSVGGSSVTPVSGHFSGTNPSADKWLSLTLPNAISAGDTVAVNYDPSGGTASVNSVSYTHLTLPTKA